MESVRDRLSTRLCAACTIRPAVSLEPLHARVMGPCCDCRTVVRAVKWTFKP